MDQIKTLQISKPLPHDGQMEVLRNLKRFNVVANGRRWGKSKLAILLSINSLLRGHHVGYFVPSFTFADDIWSEMKDRLEPFMVGKNEKTKSFNTRSGGHFKIWSLENKMAGRSRKYHRVIVDEASFNKTLLQQWEQAIRPTLADYKGDAHFLSSPVFGTDFHELHQNSERYDNWSSFNMPTHTNPYISKEELVLIESQTDPYTFAQEYLAKFIRLKGKPFVYTFNRDKHIKLFRPIDKNRPLHLSFDFNVNPMTCIVAQHAENHSYIQVLDEFRESNSNIFDLCRKIKIKYGDYFLYVTGDPAGLSRSSLSENMNHYIVIRNELGLSDSQLHVRSSHEYLKNSFVLINSLFSRHPNIYINPECRHLIKDLEMVQVLEDYQIDKKDKELSHLLDCLRYYLETYFMSFLKIRF